MGSSKLRTTINGITELPGKDAPPPGHHPGDTIYIKGQEIVNRRRSVVRCRKPLAKRGGGWPGFTVVLVCPACTFGEIFLLLRTEGPKQVALWACHFCSLWFFDKNEAAAKQFYDLVNVGGAECGAQFFEDRPVILEWSADAPIRCTDGTPGRMLTKTGGWIVVDSKALGRVIE